MKLLIVAAFLFVAVAVAVPVEEVKEKPVALEPVPDEAEDQQPADDLKTDATFWGGYHYRPYYGYGGYGGWGGYYRPYYSGWGHSGYAYPSYGYRHYSYWG